MNLKTRLLSKRHVGKLVSFVLTIAIVFFTCIISGSNAGNVHAEDLYPVLQLDDKYVQGSIDEGGGNEYYQIVLPDAGWLTITIQAWSIWHALCDIDSYDKTKTYAQIDVYGDDNAPGTDSKTFALEKGTYICKVYGPNSWQTGTYRIKASFKPANTNELEPNNSFYQTMPLGIDTMVTGFLTEYDRLDFYEIIVPKAMRIKITYKSMVESEISVWNSEFMQEGDNYEVSGTENDPTTVSLKSDCAAGNYFIKISNTGYYLNGENAGRYQLMWEEVPTLVEAIKIKGEKKLMVDDSTVLEAKITPSNASNKKIKWSSSNQSVAIVDEDGIATAKKKGTAVITAAATDGSGIHGSFTLTVVGKDPVIPSSRVVKKIKSVKLKALGSKKVIVTWKKQTNTKKYEVQIATDKKFTKNLLDKNVAKKNNNVTIKYKKTGTVYIRVRGLDNKGYVGKWSDIKKVKIK